MLGRAASFALCVSTVTSLSPSSWSRVSRRDAISKFVAAPLAATAAQALAPGAAHAVKAQTGQSSVFTGEYDDPFHPGCLRSVKVVGAKIGPDGRKQRKPTAYVKGVDSLPKGFKGCKPGVQPTLEDMWSLEGQVSEDGESIVIDFSPKGGPSNLLGAFDDFNGPGIRCATGEWHTNPHAAHARLRCYSRTCAPRQFSRRQQVDEGGEWHT